VNDEAARQGRPDTDHSSRLTLSAAAALPDPARYRQGLPGQLWRTWEFGEVSRVELWDRLERLWGADEVVRFISERRAA